MGYKKTKIHPYKSTLEYKLAKELSGYTYEPPEIKVPYSIHRHYVPDFVNLSRPEILLEVKAYMIRGQADCQKYIAIARDNPDKELVFIFSDPSRVAYSGCKRRKDGTFLTLGEWARKNDILFFHIEDIPKEIISGEWGLDKVREYKKELYGL